MFIHCSVLLVRWKYTKFFEWNANASTGNGHLVHYTKHYNIYKVLQALDTQGYPMRMQRAYKLIRLLAYLIAALKPAMIYASLS